MSLKPYSVAYRHHGREYTIEVYGESERDVMERIRSAHFNGEAQRVVARIEAPGWLGKLMGGQGA